METESKKIITVWITKYALTQGIFEREVEVSDRYPQMCTDIHTPLLNYHGNSWHKTKEEAVTHAINMKDKKIANLKKQLAKLEKLTF